MMSSLGLYYPRKRTIPDARHSTHDAHFPFNPASSPCQDMIFEQDPEQILSAILPLYFNGQLLRQMQESVASELAVRYPPPPLSSHPILKSLSLAPLAALPRRACVERGSFRFAPERSPFRGKCCALFGWIQAVVEGGVG